MKVLVALVLSIPAQVVIAVIEAFALMQIWNWLVSEEFGLVQLNGWEALGISLTAHAFLHRYQRVDPEADPVNDLLSMVADAVIYYGFAVLFAFIIYVNLP